MEIGRLYLVCLCACVLLLNVLGFTNSHPDGSKSCAKVRETFVQLSLGSPDLVPDSPAIDEGLEVCHRSLSGSDKRSCCTRDSEGKYVLASERYLMHSIQTKNAYMKSLLSKHLVDYQEQVLKMIQKAGNQTGQQLTDWYSIPMSEHHLAVNSLFVDLEQFINLGHVSITSSISKFFDNIFPVMFKNNIYDRTSVPFSHHFHHCLSKHRQNFQPQPFGDYPERIKQKLSSALIVSRAYIEALNMVLETINTTDALILEDGCKEAVTRLQYCSHCHGFMDVKPCKGFCMDVMRGCLSKLSEIAPEWSDIVTTMEGMVRGMYADNNIAVAMRDLVASISDALLHAMVHVPEFYQSVQSTCDLPSDLGEGRETPYKIPDTSKISLTKTAPVDHELTSSVMQVILDLVDSKGLYSHLPEDICAKTTLYEQDPLSGTCWNGTHVSMYEREVVDANILSQARHNQEVKVSLLLDPTLRTLKDKMSVTNLKLQGHSRQGGRDVMLGDDHVVYEASGDDLNNPWINLGQGDTLKDDEDFSDMSGSGSGEGEDVHIGTGGTNPDESVVLKPGNDGTQPNVRPYEANRGGSLTPQRPPPNQQQNRDKPPNGASIAAPASFWLLVCAVLAMVLQRRR